MRRLLFLLPALTLLGAPVWAQQPMSYVPNLALPLLKNLQHWWKGAPGFTGGLTLYDLVPGTLDHGQLTNMGYSSTSGWSPSTRTPGVWQLNLDGTNDLVDTPVNTGLTVSSPVTICVWLYPAAAATGGAAPRLLTMSGTTTYTGVLLRWGDSGTSGNEQKPDFSVNSDSGLYEIIRVPTALPLNIWHHLCGTYDGSQTIGGLALYVNGALVSSAVVSNTGFGAFTDHPWRIGANYLTTPADLFQGALESVMVFTRALPAADIQALYVAGIQGDAPLFASPLNIVAAPAGAPGSFFPFFGR